MTDKRWTLVTIQTSDGTWHYVWQWELDYYLSQPVRQSNIKANLLEHTPTK